MIEELAQLRKDFFTSSNDFEVSFKKFHKEECKTAKRRGDRDGSRDMPSTTHEKPIAVDREMAHSYASQLAELGFELGGFLDRVKKDHLATINQNLDDIRNKGISNEVSAIQAKCRAELATVEDEYHSKLTMLAEDPGLTAVQRAYDDVDDRYDELSADLGRNESNRLLKINPFVYFVGLITIGLAEVAATYNAFLNFEEPPLTTWVWAVGVGLVTALLAHFNGILISRARDKKSEIIYGLALFVAVLIVLYQLSVIRAGGMEEIEIKHLSLAAFMCISSAIYLAGVLLSFFTHDSNQVFERIIVERNQLKNKLDKTEKEIYRQKNALFENLQRAQSAINIKYNDEINKLERFEVSLQYVRNDAITLYDDILQGLKNLEKMVVIHFNECLETYRSANSAHRKSAEPDYWQSSIELNMHFNNIPEMEEQIKNQGLWHYNPN